MTEGNIHPEYYWNSVAFEVEETIFKVPTARFKKSMWDATIEPHVQGLNLGVEQWMAVLRLSTKWRILPIRKVALSHLQGLPIDPVEAVCLAKECFVDGLLIFAYEQLGEGTGKLSKQEGLKLGVERLIDIYELRDQLMQPGPRVDTGEEPKIPYQPIFPWTQESTLEYDGYEVNRRNAVDGLFKEEFEQLGIKCEEYLDTEPMYQ
ncbi:hypothetical protein C8J56DRAFT_945919 [Mycena floridula]|nr:hypothetical protein C8J56DRAFT_945919 [Mycena floridula]